MSSSEQSTVLGINSDCRSAHLRLSPAVDLIINEEFVKDASMQKIVDVLREDELYPHPEMLVTFIGNHDDRRFISVEGSSPAKLKAAFALLLTLREIPQIYSGDEITMPGGDDLDNRRDFPGGFPGDPRDAFRASGSAEQQDVFSYVKSLLALREQHAALRTGKQWHIGWGDDFSAFRAKRRTKSFWLRITMLQRPSNLIFPSKARRSKVRTACKQCLGTRQRKS